MSSTSLEDQTLRLTVSLEAEEQEEEQDEEIGGLINSDGEVVEWDASKLITTAHGWMLEIGCHVSLNNCFNFCRR